MSNLGTRHPSEEQLLHFADGEMTTPASENIRGHLKACWECRNELKEIERTIGECVRYRRIVLDTCLPSPPEPWFDIYPALAEIEESQRRERLRNRVLGMLAGVWRNPRRWIPAVATIVLIAIAVQQFRHAPSVQAAELLRKAVIAAESRPQTSRRIQIRTRTQHLTRVLGSFGKILNTQTAPDATASLESLFQAAHYSWNDPLSAKSYAEWREQLSDKRDEIIQEPGHYQLRTTSDSGELLEATLKLSSQDLHTVASTLQFRNREWVEISELPDAPALAQAAPSAESASASPKSPAKLDLPGQVPAPATPGDELAVLAVLHRLGADLGDPVDVTRAGEQILVTGTGIAPDRQQEVREALRRMSHVDVRLSSEPSAENPGIEERSPGRISVSPGAGPLQTEMETHLGGRAAFEEFADHLFDMTDAFMSRAHALRRLAQRFSPEIEAQLTSEQRRILDQLRRDHAQALLENVTAIEGGVGSMLGTAADDTGQAASSGDWQGETERLFVAARHTETLLIALLGASTDDPESRELPSQVLASLVHLRKRAENYQLQTTRQ